MSRPYWSAPNKWSADGGESALDRSWSYGSYGAIQGAATVSTRSSAAMPRPMRAPGRRNARHRAASGTAGATTISVAPLTACSGFWSWPRDPWIEDRVAQIDQEIHQHEQGGDEQRAGLHYGVVARQDGVDHQPADAGQ